jgi:hypothetical protein
MSDGKGEDMLVLPEEHHLRRLVLSHRLDVSERASNPSSQQASLPELEEIERGEGKQTYFSAGIIPLQATQSLYTACCVSRSKPLRS